MAKRPIGSILIAALLVCVALCACGCEKTAASAEKRFAKLVSEGAQLPASYVDRRVDGETNKLVISVTDMRPSATGRYVELLGEEYADLLEFEVYELSQEELGEIFDEIGSYLNARGFKYNTIQSSEGNIILFGVNEANKGACDLAGEISASFGVHVIIEVTGDVELVSG